MHTTDTFKLLKSMQCIQSCAESKINICMIFGIPKYQISRLKVVKNAAARFLKACKSLIMPLSSCDHCNGCQYRIEFKILLLVYKSLNNQAPPYLSDLLHPYTPARGLRSEGKLLLQTPKTPLKSGDLEPLKWLVPPCFWMVLIWLLIFSSFSLCLNVL